MMCKPKWLRGGENKLHSHPNLDGLWFVLKGKARFYKGHDELLVADGAYARLYNAQFTAPAAEVS